MLVAGKDSTMRYVEVLRDPWINFTASAMPNLHGLVACLQGDFRLELSLAAVIFLVFLWMTRQTENYEFLLAVSLTCGLLVSFHSGVADDVILLPALVLICASSTDVPLRGFSALILTPLPYFMVLAGAPYSAAVPVSLLVLLALASLALWKRGVSPANVLQPNPQAELA
jgi:hypothetical protein